MNPALFLWWTTMHLTLGCGPVRLMRDEIDQHQYRYTFELWWFHGLETKMEVRDRFRDERIL